ncbi:permease-like cell division protein FtsX [Thermosynechococcaceae cyanobacterium Okahandja]
MANLNSAPHPWPTLDFLIPEVRRSLWRGGWLNGAAVIAVAVTLFIFGWGWQVSHALGATVAALGNRLEITAYVAPDLATPEIDRLRQTLATLPGVDSLTWIDRDRAWAELQADLGLATQEGDLHLFERNPLSDEVKIRAKSLEQVTTLATQIAQQQGIESVQYLERALDGLQRLQRLVRTVTIGLVLLLGVTVVALVSAILRLVILVRQPDIEIMILVGASQRWIHTPFFVQAGALGGLGGAAAWLAGWSSSHHLQYWLSHQFTGAAMVDRVPLEWSSGFGISLVIAGILLGGLSTLLALNTAAQG